MTNRASLPEYGRWCVELLIVVLLYFGAARLGLLMAFTYKNVSPVWPPSGLALAVLLTRGTRVWPAISLGAFLANFSTDLSFQTALLIAIGNTLEAVIGVTLLRRVEFQSNLARLRDTLWFILLAGMLSTTVAATIGVAGLGIGGFLQWDAWRPAWWTWWLGDTMGILVIAPVLLTCTAPPASLRARTAEWKPGNVVEAVLLLVSLVGITRYIFDGGKEYPYVVFPLLIWAAMRFLIRGAAFAVLIVSGLAIWGTLQESGPFIKANAEQSLAFLQTFMSVVSVTTLIMAAVMTERERGEVTQAQLLAEVEHQRKRLDDLLATLPATVWEAYGQPDEARQRIDFVSNYIEKLLGYSVEEWLAEPNFWLKIVHPDDQQEAARVATEAFTSGKPHSQRFRWIARDGCVIWMETHAVTIRDSEGCSIGMRGVNIDVTETKRIEEEREQLVEELRQHQANIEALNERLRRAVAETHHRVKNNLQVICALLELQELNGKEQVPMSEIRRLVQHVRSLAVIHDLLTRETKVTPDVEYIQIREAMQQLMPLLQSVAGSRRLHFTVEDLQVPIQQATALAVLVNELVSNALKHGAGNIDISLTVSHSAARLEVRDCGPGFPSGFAPEEDSHTGLELIHSLSTWDLGGNVSFENDPEGGARVVVTFPITRTEAQEL